MDTLKARHESARFRSMLAALLHDAIDKESSGEVGVAAGVAEAATAASIPNAPEGQAVTATLKVHASHCVFCQTIYYILHIPYAQSALVSLLFCGRVREGSKKVHSRHAFCDKMAECDTDSCGVEAGLYPTSWLLRKV
jgi:hypothetical protein